MGNANSAAEASDLSGTVEAPVQTPARLLVIDDDTIHRMVICSIAEKLNFAAVAAASFDEAVKLLKAEPFACITLDLSLGTRHGAEMLPIIAETGCKAPLVIISGSNDDIRKETVRVAQMLALDVVQMEKPVNLPELRKTLSQFHPDSRATLVPTDS
jgi:CheY-like chemotaxis protein